MQGVVITPSVPNFITLALMVAGILVAFKVAQNAMKRG